MNTSLYIMGPTTFKLRGIALKWKFYVTSESKKITQVQYSDYAMEFYSETTLAVGIAQLTHHEVQGGGQNPETGGRGIFAPTADRVVS